ncbi:RNA polymerase sigma factor [Paenibacillus sp. SYP-B4298]|uniref:RNA polymerase sigma factor n=1 Tax=Paenibacillus sp. SYP-B4298 TaxID=2996034 RepID=UPI003FA7E85C
MSPFYHFSYREVIILIKDHALAEDIIQEAFLKATAKRHQLNHAASAKQWIRRIVRNQMLDIIRKKIIIG